MWACSALCKKLLVFNTAGRYWWLNFYHWLLHLIIVSIFFVALYLRSFLSVVYCRRVPFSFDLFIQCNNSLFVAFYIITCCYHECKLCIEREKERRCYTSWKISTFLFLNWRWLFWNFSWRFAKKYENTDVTGGEVLVDVCSLIKGCPMVRHSFVCLCIKNFIWDLIVR
jgi:hypothetical protein